MRLLQPYGELRLHHGRYIPVSAQRFVTYVGKHGDDVAAEVLTQLYAVAEYLTVNLNELQTRWRELRTQLETRCRTPIRSRAALMEATQRAWRQLKAGLLTTEAYERLLRAARASYEEWGIALDGAVEVLWLEAGFQLSRDLRNQLMLRVDPALELDIDDYFDDEEDADGV